MIAGNVARIERTFTRAEGETGSVNPSTAKVSVTSPAGVATALVVDPITYNGDDSALTVVAHWVSPDDTPGGTYTVTIDVSGNMTAAWQESLEVEARHQAVLP